MEQKLKSSFRDNAGYLFVEDGILYRKVLKDGLKDFRALESSGLKDALLEKNLIVNYSIVDGEGNEDSLVIKPEKLSFISYPYEWSFAQYRSAALATLYIQKLAISKGMSLKDASAYNMQFVNGKPVLIDTLSFEVYSEGNPWVAYRQFCQHFLAPLALASKVDVNLLQMMRLYIDGIPLELASRLLPIRTKLSPGLATHIHLHARSQSKHASKADSSSKQAKVSQKGMLGLIDHLQTVVNKLVWKGADTEWGEYYTFTNYSEDSFERKKSLVSEFIKACGPETLWDLGANDGTFSRLASEKGIATIAFDIDPVAVDKNYRRIRKEKTTHLLPLKMDLTNPSPSLGWGSEERDDLVRRGPADCVMALALIHHLAISNNVPFDRIAEYFSQLSKFLIIEFVPKEDSQVEILLATRKDIFPDYTIEGFENVFTKYYDLVKKAPIPDTQRTLYLFERR